jgi:hypothetical protein
MGETFERLADATSHAARAVKAGQQSGKTEMQARALDELTRGNEGQGVLSRETPKRCACGKVPHVAGRWCTRCFREHGVTDLYMDVTDGMAHPAVKEGASEDELMAAAEKWVKENEEALIQARVMAQQEWQRIKRSRNRESRRPAHSAAVVVAPATVKRVPTRTRPLTAFELALRTREETLAELLVRRAPR